MINRSPELFEEAMSIPTQAELTPIGQKIYELPPSAENMQLKAMWGQITHECAVLRTAGTATAPASGTAPRTARTPASGRRARGRPPKPLVPTAPATEAEPTAPARRQQNAPAKSKSGVSVQDLVDYIQQHPGTTVGTIRAAFPKPEPKILGRMLSAATQPTKKRPALIDANGATNDIAAQLFPTGWSERQAA